MSDLLNTNMSRAEKIRRYITGATLLAIAMFNPNFPVWVALVACYPIFTGMLEIDPVTMAINKVLQTGRKLRRSIASINNAPTTSNGHAASNAL
jgi:hypothetical protein